ncbi:plasmid pRiA4b ORF-3 family protein [Deltaproteobacteria bacterium TL4]
MIYQLKVTLKGSKPPIWRRIQVASDINLSKLHRILQIVMGWEDCHLHQYIIGGMNYGKPDHEFGNEIENESRVKLDQFRPKMKFVYEYDFGDSWGHEMVVEKTLLPEEGVSYPICITGKRACPPEDCGGIWGYASFLEAIQNPGHPEHEEMLEWAGGEFDPEAFDLDAINQELKRLR